MRTGLGLGSNNTIPIKWSTFLNIDFIILNFQSIYMSSNMMAVDLYKDQVVTY
jgi:hypothetical protein